MRGAEDLLASILSDSGAVLFGEFRLASGRLSHIYIDLRRLLGRPSSFRIVASLLASRVEDLKGSLGVDLLAGVATGGIAWASAVALLTGMPAAYVRPRKEHGTEAEVEGGSVEGRRALIIDDVATTGQSIAAAAGALRRAGAVPVAALVVVDREQGARELLRGEGLQLYSLATLRGLLESFEKMGLIGAQARRALEEELWGRAG